MIVTHFKRILDRINNPSLLFFFFEFTEVEHLISDPTAPQMKLEEIVLDTNDDSRQLDEFLNN